MLALPSSTVSVERGRRSDDVGGRRALLATPALAGLRIGEALALRWCDVDLAAGRLGVGESKTDAGRRDWICRGLFAMNSMLRRPA